MPHHIPSAWRSPRLAFLTLIIIGAIGVMLSGTMLPRGLKPTAGASSTCQFLSSPGATPAFCEDLSGGPKQGGRAGELDPAKWSVSRIVNWDATNLLNFPQTPVTACKSGVTNTTADKDIIFCDAASGHQGQFMTAMSAQNYAILSMRPRQPFDFAGRTGTISFNVDATSLGPLSWWSSLYVTDEPIPGASYQERVTGEIPKNGIGVSIDGNNCANSSGGQERINDIFTFNDYTQTDIPVTNNPCINTQRGSLNHMEFRLSQTHVEVWASDFSTDGGHTFPNFQMIGSAAISLNFSKGYVHYQQEERAPIKYHSNPPYANNYWSDLAFDGPSLPGDTGYQVPDALTTNPNGGLNVGYGLQSGPGTNSTYACCDASGGQIPVAPFMLPNVDTTGLTGAALSFSISFFPTDANHNSSTFATKYRLNGGAWKPVSPTPEYAKALYCGTWCNNPPPPSDAAWAMGFSFPVAVSDLKQGANTLEIGEDGANNGWPPALANVDLLTFKSGCAPSCPVPTTTTLTSSKNPSAVGDAVTLSATVSSESGTPTGTVHFTDGAAALGSTLLNASGVAVLTTSSLAVGTHTIIASYTGATGFNASQSPSLSQVVNGTQPSGGLHGTTTVYSFVSPSTLQSVRVHNLDSNTTTVSLSCPGNPTVTGQVAAGTSGTLTTNWKNSCSAVVTMVSNNANVSIGGLVYTTP